MKSGFHDAIALLGRVLLAGLFIYGGIEKIPNYAPTARLMTSHGVPGALLPAVIALELGGGLALIFGFLTRLVGAALAVYSAAAILIFIVPPANQVMTIVALAETAMIGGLLAVVASGAGRFSMDRLLFRPRGNPFGIS